MRFETVKKAASPVAVAVAMAAALAAGGTFAYLTATASDANLLSLGKVGIALSETGTGKDDPSTAGVVENEYEIARAADGSWAAISKDPTVTVTANSADCWVFVAMGESGDFSKCLTYQVAEGWSPLLLGDGTTQAAAADGSKVWFREAPKADKDAVIRVLAGAGAAEAGAVTVKAGVTDAQIRALGTAESPNPTLTVTAYAVQKAGLTALDAWSLLGA